MNRQEWVEEFDALTLKMRCIMIAKNSDYANQDNNPFSNFERVETLGIARTEVGFLTRMTDKLCRINSFVQKGELAVKDESVQDTLLDLANYSLLMIGYLKSKKKDGIAVGPIVFGDPTIIPGTKATIVGY